MCLMCVGQQMEHTSNLRRVLKENYGVKFPLLCDYCILNITFSQ
jgi:hypothetical protein